MSLYHLQRSAGTVKLYFEGFRCTLMNSWGHDTRELWANNSHLLWRLRETRVTNTRGNIHEEASKHAAGGEIILPFSLIHASLGGKVADITTSLCKVCTV
jgi:hypothetical protein